jgi:serine/threonine protein phosphatase 1
MSSNQERSITDTSRDEDQPEDGRTSIAHLAGDRIGDPGKQHVQQRLDVPFCQSKERDHQAAKAGTVRKSNAVVLSIPIKPSLAIPPLCLNAYIPIWGWLFRDSMSIPQVPTPRIPEGTRIYAVADIHGRADLLGALLERIDSHLRAFPIARPIQVFLGDYIDRGPRSREVLDLLIERRRHCDMICLRGNHETLALGFLDDPFMLSDWSRVGGRDTLFSYGVSPGSGHRAQRKAAGAFRQALPDNHRQFLQDLPLSFTLGDFFFVHAGVRPGVPLHEQNERDLLWIRQDFLLHQGDFGKVVIHGHTPTLEPDVRPNRINIDTGACATGRLTCLILERDEMEFI